jgi:hypothetical protein
MPYFPPRPHSHSSHPTTMALPTRETAPRVKRPKLAPVWFAVVADALDAVVRGLLFRRPKTTAIGSINTASKHLTSSFAFALSNKPATPVGRQAGASTRSSLAIGDGVRDYPSLARPLSSPPLS